MSRKRLTDISNLQLNADNNKINELSAIELQIRRINFQKLQQHNLQLAQANSDLLMQLNSGKDREIMALTKINADNNKIFELSSIELQKRRINFQKLQQQNLQLAQANCDLLVQLNSGKDRLKALQHELGCKNGLIQALKIVSQGNAKTVTCEKCGDKLETLDGTAGSSQAEKDDALRHSGKQDKAKEKTENKRRRQSARLKPEEPKPNEDLFKIDNVVFPVCSLRDECMHDSGPTSSGSEVKEEDQGDCAPGSGVGQSRKSSIGRPRRQAAEKIQSYKEIPLNVKMNRKEDTHDSGPTSSGSEVKSQRSSIGRPQRRAAEKVQSYKETPLNVKMWRK